MLKPGHAHRGFTLIEVIIGVAIMAILLALAAPSLSVYSENSKLRGMAESFVAGAQTARAEAIRTNQSVEMALTLDAPTAANAGTANLSPTASGWIIRSVSDDPTPVYRFVGGRNAREASSRSDGSSSVGLSARSDGVPTASIIFTGAGTTSLTSRWQVDLVSSTAACAPAGPVRCQRVVVTVSGQIKACDPAATVANDTRSC